MLSTKSVYKSCNFRIFVETGLGIKWSTRVNMP